MNIKKRLMYKLKKALIGSFFVFVGLIGLTSVTAINTAQPVFAVPENDPTTLVEDNNEGRTENTNVAPTERRTTSGGDGCKSTVGPISWLVCSVTKTVANAVDKLYEVIEQFLVVNPILVENDSPIHEIWKYIKGITNVVFIIFLLIVIYSQITGLGISNYGIKKSLPKLIIAAVLVNLSFLICQLAVDASNIIGDGLRGMFASIEGATMGGAAALDGSVTWTGMYAAIAGGETLLIGAGVAAIALSPGVIWMLIPAVLGALVAVVTGLVTIAMRQAVVALLVMIAPLAMVANMLPNTEQWFKKWKDLLMKMLVFYPMFSLLFGASSLAGYAIMMSAQNGFALIIGAMVQVFPLFFSWKLMSMSGTFLNGIHAKLNSFAAKPLATNRAWAESRRALSRARHLERNRTPSAKLLNFVAGQKYNRENETGEINKFLQAGYEAKYDARDYEKNGRLSKRGQKRYQRQALTMRYTQFSQMHKDNLNEGFGEHDANYRKTIADMRESLLRSKDVYSSAIKGGTYADRIKMLDQANMDASDDLRFEMARGAKIEFDNAAGFQKRVTDAMNAHLDQEALEAGNKKYKLHGVLEDDDNIARYNRMKNIMEGKEIDVHFAAADAASTFNAQSSVMRNKFQTYFDLTAPTQDVVNRLNELTTSGDSSEYIDSIVAGLRTLNMRGDTDLVGDQIEELLKNKKIELGTYASQSLANFLMFDVKGNDPFLRRFGKYINLETARMYNEPEDEAGLKKRRRRKYITMDEYVNGEYDENSEEEMYYDEETGQMVKDKPKRGAKVLLQGTSFKDMERTAMANMMKRIREHSMVDDGNGDKKLDMDKFTKNEEDIWNAIMPNVISDQFSFLSGSEQIMAFANTLTGMKDGKPDWEGIFGGEVASKLSDEDKLKYLEKASKRTKTFLGGHVPNQITRSKTDVLQAVQAQYAMLDDITYKDKEGKEHFDLKKMKEFEEAWKPEMFMDPTDKKQKYSKFLEDKESAIRNRFRGSLKDNTKEVVAKQVRKGYQGDAKDLFFNMMFSPEELREFNSLNNGNNRRRRDDNIDDEDDDALPPDGYYGVDTDGGIYNDTRNDVEQIFREYYGPRRNDVIDCWERIRDVILSSVEMGESTTFISDLEQELPQYTDVSQLRERIMRYFFGSD